MLLGAFADQEVNIRVQLGFHKDRYWLQAPNKDEFALISLRFSKALKRLDRLSCVDMDTIVASSQLKAAIKTWKTGGKLPVFHIEANIYGHYHQAEDVGTILMTSNLFLQSPQTDLRKLNFTILNSSVFQANCRWKQIVLTLRSHSLQKLPQHLSLAPGFKLSWTKFPRLLGCNKLRLIQGSALSR